MSGNRTHTQRVTGSSDHGRKAATPSPILVEATHGPGKGARATLTQGTLFVGSGEGCDLTLDDPAVSRRHAQLDLLPGAVHVRDLGSRNGTRYLGAKVADARVPLGGSIVLGKTTLSLSPAVQAALSEREVLGGLHGRSPAMRRLFAELERLGPTSSTVLLEGESGTGKDLAARALHELSARADRPWVVFDCAAVAPSLIESELFGHARGAFTGAVRARPGVFEQAHGGTLFLDEVGELPMEVQPRLLRALERREVKRVGEGDVRKVDVRVVAATHRSLEAEVRTGRFRQDLFFRLAVAMVRLPPLRERPEDVPLLAGLFARRAAGDDVELGPATLAALQCEDFPGNVRELRNAVERALHLGATRSTPGQAAAPPNFHQAREKLVDQFERDFVSSLLRRHHGNATAAAKAAGLARSHFYRLLDKHGLRQSPGDADPE
ncbi:MAG: sigma 54-interacting transcriptional regulator [Myxococcaceae bacterium]|nr:sigma 54-interacting transcriptional regulator [Myxococcaceae bacterium]